jgi:hypothetical protein
LTFILKPELFCQLSRVDPKEAPDRGCNRYEKPKRGSEMKRLKEIGLALAVIASILATTSLVLAAPPAAKIQKLPEELITPLKIASVTGDATPGAELIIKGSGFGPRGTVTMKGVRGPSGISQDLHLLVSSWDDHYIAARFDPITGKIGRLIDSKAMLVVTTLKGQQVSVPINFIAERVIMPLPRELAQFTRCPSDTANCYDTCDRIIDGNSHYLLGFHECRDRNHQGVDRFTITPLKNGWVVNDGVFLANASDIMRATVNAGFNGGGYNQPWANGEISWATALESGYPSLYGVRWKWSITIRGPKGVPYK